MTLSLAMLWSDWIIWALVVIAALVFFYIRQFPHLREPWGRVFRARLGMVAAVILGFYVVIGLMDSIHFEVTASDKGYQMSEIQSALDLALSRLSHQDEETYSAPFATHSYTKTVIPLPGGGEKRGYARLQHGGSHLKYETDKTKDIVGRVIIGVVIGIASLIVLLSVFLWGLSRRGHQLKHVFLGRTEIAWREMIIAFSCAWLVIVVLIQLMFVYHIFGTDKIGHDVFYASVKSIRTGLLIGLLTTIFMLPLALLLGMAAGFFGGWIDDVIQYLYTTLSSIPSVLLISAAILVMQVYISSHPELFPRLIERADARLLALCIILGITSWASLCRLLRAETLKLRELEFVQAAKALGVGKIKMIIRHIAPNVMHIVLITIVLDFSALVLAEAVLSYVGVGVDPTTYSWGNMINSSRLELAREPIVWWPLLSALVFMFILVLSANLFADSVRDALDPRIRD